MTRSSSASPTLAQRWEKKGLPRGPYKLSISFKLLSISFKLKDVERARGFEPPTPTLAREPAGGE
jgi:hypothetical protein